MKIRDAIARSVESELIVLMPDGEEIPVSEEILNLPELRNETNLAALIRTEIIKSQPNEAPPSIQAMQDLELVDYEAASDKGHFRFPPKGALIHHLLQAWAEEIALNRLGAYAIETPILYNWNEPDIRAQAESFHERHYKVHTPEGKEEFILRFAGDFGLFRMMKEAQLTFRHLPARIYEFAPSFRYEQSGELSGLRRLRAFWMPDVHSFCLDLDQGLSEYLELFKRYTDLADGTGVSYAVAFRIVRSFYEEHKTDLLEMISYSGHPVLIDLLSDMKHYWVMKHEINTIDCCQGVCQVSTVQLDTKDASIYDINYVTSENDKRGCTIVHSSIGSPERWMFSILEDALKKTPPTLPLWLAPTQLRLLPVSLERHSDNCLALSETIQKSNIRIDIDDRSHPINWRVRAAEREWIPYIIVVGDKEVGTDIVPVRVRGCDQRPMAIPELVKSISKQTEGMPFRSLPGVLVSRRPVFRGRD